jgi:ligand-binding sensor protein
MEAIIMNPDQIETTRQYMIGLIRGAYANCIPVVITLHGKFKGLKVSGQVGEIDDKGVKVIQVEDEDEDESEWKWVPFSHIIAAEFDQEG